MIKLLDILLEREYPKGKYIQITDPKELENLQSQLFDLIQNAYASIGGHVKFKSPSDIMHTGIGHDGDRPNIKSLLKHKTNLLKTPGNYVEVSGDAFDSFVGYGGAPIVDDEETVKNILAGKSIEWHGAHPTDPTKKGNGWYTRYIGGKKLTKIMAGIPQ